MNTKHNVKQRTQKLVVTSIRLDSETHQALKSLAADERRSVSQQMRHLIDTALKAAA